MVEKGYKRSYLREAGGSRVKQEWWIALCLVPGVGQTPRGQIFKPADLKMALGLNKSGGLRCALSPVWDRPLGVKSSSQQT